MPPGPPVTNLSPSHRAATATDSMSFCAQIGLKRAKEELCPADALWMLFPGGASAGHLGASGDDLEIPVKEIPELLVPGESKMHPPIFSEHTNQSGARPTIGANVPGALINILLYSSFHEG